MDPGNWGTDLQGGAQFKYGLLWVVGLASLMAIFLQIIAARVGIATGRDLAQCCYDWYPKWTRVPNWLMAELAIIACDLAEVLGGAVALNMLFHIPIFWGVIITGIDVLLLLAMQRFGMRTIEAIVLLLVATIGVCYFIEIFILPQTQPSFLEMGRAMITPISVRLAWFMWRSGSSAQRSCRTCCICTPHWCRAVSASRALSACSIGTAFGTGSSRSR